MKEKECHIILSGGKRVLRRDHTFRECAHVLPYLPNSSRFLVAEDTFQSKQCLLMRIPEYKDTVRNEESFCMEMYLGVGFQFCARILPVVGTGFVEILVIGFHGQFVRVVSSGICPEETER